MSKKVLILIFLIMVVIYVCIKLFTDVQLPSGLLRTVFFGLLIAYFVMKKMNKNNSQGNSRI